MKASEVVSRLNFLMKQHGDMEVFMDTNPDHLHKVEEIDVDAEDTGFIFWPRETSATPLERDDSVGVSCLSIVGIVVDEAIVSTWTDEQYWQAMDWATAEILVASDNDDVEVPQRPAFLEQYQA